MKRYLFFSRHYNDVDNIYPAIYFLLKQDDSAMVDILFYSDDYDFRDNVNVKFLKKCYSERVIVTWLGELLGLSTKWNYKNPNNRWFYRAYGRINPIKSISRVRAGHPKLDQEKLDQQLKSWINDPIKPCLAVFDQNRSYMVKGLTASLRRLGIKHVISLPVSPFSNMSTLRSVDMVALTDDLLQFKHDYTAFDKVGVVDRFYLESMERTYALLGRTSPLRDRAIPLGSIRYCKEWLDVRKNEELFSKLEEKSLVQNKSDKPIITFFLSDPATNAFWDEILRTIQFISQFEDYECIIKPHPRKKLKKLANGKNIRIDSKSQSSALIDQSDIILFWGSSIALEGYIKGKLMACLDYVNGNHSVYEKFDAGYVMKSRDDLHFLLATYLKSPKDIPYNQEGVDQMIHEVVYCGERTSVSERYLKYIKQYIT